jgi:dynein heavy chain
MPVFGGTLGQQYTNNILELEKTFKSYLEKIKQLDYDILDVKITQWHDDYGHLFKENVKNLEMNF